MCGIAGYVAKNSEGVDLRALEWMTRAVRHRGPDDEGFFVEANVGFGHRRLSIIDLSSDGHQPMSRAGEGLTVTFNGEIYNYLELKSQLEVVGYRFITRTDTEVLLAAYAHWGEQCVQHFNGMWAFALHDRRRNRIFCSRDRFGVKPFYYAESTKAWIFGSEIRQLLPFLPRVLAKKSVLVDFLLTGATDDRPETFFEGVLRLPAGHNLVFDLASHRYELKRYYELAVDPKLKNVSVEEAIELYGHRLSEAVALRLRADVPVGTCLSGGLDSSSVATLASTAYFRMSGDRFKAITAASGQSTNDESACAQQVVESAGLDWLVVNPSYDDFAASLGDVVRAQEEPFASPSICMQYFVMRCAHENNIPVLLDGQGGDETLLGYERYYAAHLIDMFRRHGSVYFFRSLLASRDNNTKMSLPRLMLYLVYFSSAHVRFLNYLKRHRHLKIVPAMPFQLKAHADAIGNIDTLQRLEIELQLPSLLRYEDKNSMWHSVETRLPFLDYRSVETAISLPGESKIHLGWTKYLLRRFMNGKMPDAITWRKSKIGFEAPDQYWLGRHADVMQDAVCKSSIVAELYRVENFGDKYCAMAMENRWRLYSIALWESCFHVKCKA